MRDKLRTWWHRTRLLHFLCTWKDCKECGGWGESQCDLGDGNIGSTECSSCRGYGNWIQPLLDRIPRPMWQIGLQYKQQRVDWGYVMPTYDQETIDMERDNLSYYERIVVRIVWMSPAWLDQQPEFEGW